MTEANLKEKRFVFFFEFQRGHCPSCQEMHGDRTKRLACPIVPAVKKREQETGTGYTASEPDPSAVLSKAF